MNSLHDVRTAALVMVLLAGVWQTGRAEMPAADTPWDDASEMQLQVDFPGQGYEASWELFRCACGDLLIRSELKEPGETVHGDIALIGNRAVLTRGFGTAAEELLSVDAPVLMMQLALRLLQRAVPAGPAAVTVRREVSVTDPVNYINLDTGAAVGGFPAPWSVSGSLWPVGASVRRFDLEFLFNAGGPAGDASQAGRLRLTGSADFARQPFPLQDDLELTEWTLEWRDAEDPLSGRVELPATLGELRRRVTSAPR